ncbi:ATPase domain-containing protein [Methyloterricola oryzae]|nr:ATPase domain-containing protein [Methyloterricola oryzae]
MEPLLKIPSGIKGLDKITQGGLPKGRAVLVAGGPGSGKTLLGIQPA